MRLIDADKLHREEIDYFLGYSIQQIENAPTVCDIEQIRAEIEETIESYVCNKEENTMKAQGMLNAMRMTFEIIDKYKGDKE